MPCSASRLRSLSFLLSVSSMPFSSVKVFSLLRSSSVRPQRINSRCCKPVKLAIAATEPVLRLLLARRKWVSFFKPVSLLSSLPLIMVRLRSKRTKLASEPIAAKLASVISVFDKSSLSICRKRFRCSAILSSISKLLKNRQLRLVGKTSRT
ncbi:MAG: hypothetical protein BWY75_03133 [bacterium ADurb.Bin425]|nr:MAG: hypothetical protein BWY75_03133 [bacterium ADurb.Bin425]